MAFNILFTLRAEERLDHILNYLIQNWGFQVYDEFVRELEHCLGIIELNPYSFSLCGLHDLRKCVITPLNILYYIIKGNDIVIVSIEDTRTKPFEETF